MGSFGGMASRTDRKPPGMRAGDEQKPHPIRIHSQGQGNGFYSEGNQKPRGGLGPGRSTA